MNLEDRCKPIELIMADVDGVLTDGGIIYNNQGIEIKRFHIHDGLGIKLWRNAGFHFGIVTGRSSHIVKMRAAELGVDVLRQGFENKLPVVREIMHDLKLTQHQVAYIGDDLPDLPVLLNVGLPIAAANAVTEVRAAAAYITKSTGGFGAVREAIEIVLKAKGLWEDLISKYVAQ